MAILFFCAGKGYTVAALEEEPIESRIQRTSNLQALYSLGVEEKTKLYATWNSLRNGADTQAKAASISRLEQLKNLIAQQGGELTGLTTEERGASQLRIRRGFFTEAQAIYDEFIKKLLHLLTNNQGTLKEEEGAIYGKLIAWAGQRSIFYGECFDVMRTSTDHFMKGGAGAVLSEYTNGYTASIAPTLGQYFYPQNPHLTLLMIAKEDMETASQLNDLLTSFHEPLGITERRDYMFPFGEALAAKRSALEGELSLERVQRYLADSDFWERKKIPAELKRNTGGEATRGAAAVASSRQEGGSRENIRPDVGAKKLYSQAGVMADRSRPH
ncbi:MAG: hypothetical protein A2977_00895 [Alphaproteobacteria bacterium RIFCSPLOWO2_01_FULL_45_8]|nr:MAG: hypothetical protein A2065_01605 [Alphaproteobacteria bacterium GWB1_45_5]OFW89999.1 MAG: hypothetical protein A2621_03925 [Alphaproteobacteria bacterium RIFCSPHIGHO2_01_FULL_41_14]OFW95960.1 MAG: hypothetical protein A2977_00895 [Alphaproteobacteria bacterium RIFCSPLOWO2_01_FULL_45_8]